MRVVIARWNPEEWQQGEMVLEWIGLEGAWVRRSWQARRFDRAEDGRQALRGLRRGDDFERFLGAMVSEDVWGDTRMGSVGAALLEGGAAPIPRMRPEEAFALLEARGLA